MPSDCPIEKELVMTTTTNPESVIDPGSFTVTRTIRIAANPAKVWSAITDPAQLSRWFGQRAEFTELAVGATGFIGFDGYGDFAARIEELNPPHSITYRWGSVMTDDNRDDDLFEKSTIFRLTLEEVDGDTSLTVVESGFETLDDPRRSMEDNRGGWNSELDELVVYVEGVA